MLKVKAVIFDLDGLLINSEIIAKVAWSRAMDDCHYHLSNEFYLQLIGISLQDDIGMFYQNYGADFPFDKVYAKRQIYYNEIIEKDGIQLKPGVKEITELLDRAAIKKGIATSSPRHFASRKLSVAGLDGTFETIIFGDDIKNGKPSPDIFLLAAKKINCSPKECIVLEDSEAGISAAYAAGMVPFMVPDLQPPTLSIRDHCYHIFRSLFEVRDYLTCFWL